MSGVHPGASGPASVAELSGPASSPTPPVPAAAPDPDTPPLPASPPCPPTLPPAPDVPPAPPADVPPTPVVPLVPPVPLAPVVPLAPEVPLDPVVPLVPAAPDATPACPPWPPVPALPPPEREQPGGATTRAPPSSTADANARNPIEMTSSLSFALAHHRSLCRFVCLRRLGLRSPGCDGSQSLLGRCSARPRCCSMRDTRARRAGKTS